MKYIESSVTLLQQMDGMTGSHRCMPAPLISQTLYSYFTTRIVDDGLPVDDFMISSVYKLALSVFHYGYVQKIQVCNEIISNSIFIQANCLPEMKRDRIYSTRLSCSGRNHPLRPQQFSVAVQLAEALVQVDPSCILVGIVKM